MSEQGTYSVKVSMGNCISESNNITVDFKDCNCKVYLPNIFSPNSDGSNDEFSLFSNCKLSDFHLVIFNRRGGTVFETNNFLDMWDGTSKGLSVQTGVYVYELNYQNIDGIVQNVIGTITLIR